MNPSVANVNAKTINQNSSSKTPEIRDEDIEVSYNDVLKGEVSKVSRHRSRQNTNQGNAKPMNSCPNPNSNDLNEFMRLVDRRPPLRPIFPPPPPPRPHNIKGDINNDGKLDQSDVATLEKYNDGESVRINLKNADINEDGEINSEDTKALQKFINPNIGDVNGDGKVTQADVHALKEYQEGNNTDINLKNADFDGNHRITDADVDKLQSLVDELHPDMGDANGDGIVNAKDYDLMQRVLDGSDEEINMDKADMDGDGEITSADLEKVQQLVDEHEAQVETMIGDINGDGVVDESDHENLKNYINNVDSSDDFIRKNSDINGDGTIDEKDLQGLRDQLDGINVNYSEGELTGDVNGDGKVTRADKEALKNYINRESNGNDEFYINNADVNGDGKIDKKDVAELSRQVDNGHRPHRLRPTPHPQPQPIIPPRPSPIRPTNVTHNIEDRPDYKPWTDTIKRFQPIFTNSDLNNRSGSEFISVGLKINVVSETDNAYRVQYPTARGEQTGWIGKNAFQRPQSIQDVLQNMISEFVGKIWQNQSNSVGMESKNFASFVFNQMNNIGDIGSVGNQSRGNNYRLNINAEFVGVRGSNQFLTKHNAKSMFRDAQVGDFVQMRRRNGDSHSAILAEMNSKGVRLLENNVPDQNGSFVYNRVNLTFYSYERLASDNASMSLYYPKGEEV